MTQSAEKQLPKACPAAGGIIRNLGSASILIVTEWLPLLRELHLCPTQENGQARSERHVPAESVPLYEESDSSSGRHPSHLPDTSHWQELTM